MDTSVHVASMQGSTENCGPNSGSSTHEERQPSYGEKSSGNNHGDSSVNKNMNLLSENGTTLSPIPSLVSGLSDLNLTTTNPSPPPTASNSGFPRGDYVPPLPGTGMDATNVFIKYLPTELTNTGLFTLFSQFGEITSCKVMVDPVTGFSLGYGFVRFTTAEEAANAITTMCGATVGNKVLLCKLSHGIPQNNATPSDNLYIKPLLDTTTEEELLAIFSPYGRVLECKVMMDKNTGQSRQIGFVRFNTIEEATKALAANNGRYLTEDAPPMVVKYAESRSQKMARRAKLLANQAAAESRRAAAQLRAQSQPEEEQQIHSDGSAHVEAGSPGVDQAGHSEEPFLDASSFPQSSPQNGSAIEEAAPAPASIPYVVKDQYGNVTFAPGQPTETSNQQWYPGYQDSKPKRGGARRGRGAYRTREPQYVPPYHIDPQTVPEVDDFRNPSPEFSSYPINSFAFPDTPTPHVQLAGKVDQDENGSLVAPEWADDPTKLFISHLPPGYDADSLKSLFESHGTVISSKISQDKRSLKPKCYGFIQYSTPEEAASAVKELHGTMVENRPINVAYEATQRVAQHKYEVQQQYFLQQQQQQISNMGMPSMHSNGYGRGAKRGRGGGGRSRAARPRFGQSATYYTEYAGEGIQDPYVYFIDPQTGRLIQYPVYYPSGVYQNSEPYTSNP